MDPLDSLVRHPAPVLHALPPRGARPGPTPARSAARGASQARSLGARMAALGSTVGLLVGSQIEPAGGRPSPARHVSRLHHAPVIRCECRRGDRAPPSPARDRGKSISAAVNSLSGGRRSRGLVVIV